MDIAEIVLPETKPETEWVRGRALQKVSPKRTHSRVQTTMSARLYAWAGGRGEVGTEWRFRIAIRGEARRPLVPDVCYVAAEAFRGYSDDELEAPPFAPTVAIEILSPGDLRADVESKIDVYLRGGASLVVVVDPKERTMLVCDKNGRATLCAGDTLVHEALPDFALPLRDFFAAALDTKYQASEEVV